MDKMVEKNSRGENTTLKMAVTMQEILSQYKENFSHMNEMDSLGHPGKFPATKNVPMFSKQKELRATCQGPALSEMLNYMTFKFPLESLLIWYLCSKM